jgi:hypothetical protein
MFGFSGSGRQGCSSARSRRALRLERLEDRYLLAGVDDAFEQNDTFATARDLGRLGAAATFDSLIMADGNDWYRFTTAAKGGASDDVSISFQNSQGNLNLELYNVTGQRLSSSSSTTADAEQVSLYGRAAGTYYVRVFGLAGATNPDYSLTINPPKKLVDDAFEENDSRLAARNLGTLTSEKIIPNLVMADSHDWYKFAIASPGTSANFVAINFQNSQGNLNLELYNSAGTRIGVSSGTIDSEMISLNGRAAGTYYVHVFGVGGAINPNYTLQIEPPGAPPTSPLPGSTTFDINFRFSGVTPSQAQIFLQAAAKWQSIIVGDVPNSAYFAPGSTRGVLVDDVLIDASGLNVDGVGGVLGQSSPDFVRSSSLIPIHGTMEFDSADLASLEANGTLLAVIEHEIAHVLGFGSLWASKGLIAGAGTANSRYLGAQGVAAYNSVFHPSPTATSVPLENTGGAGTADSHWRESVFGNELMTGFLGPGLVNPLSIVTIAAMKDLGYTVNLGAADPYTPPSALLAVVAGPSDPPSGDGLMASLKAQPALPDIVPAARVSWSTQLPLASGATNDTPLNSKNGGHSDSTAAIDELLANWSLKSEL